MRELSLRCPHDYMLSVGPASATSAWVLYYI